ncbi:MAG: Uma2 family endonuclease [Pyrinomonadaceae bacterium]
MQPVLERKYKRPRIITEPVVKNGTPKLFKWSVNEYYQIAELGFFNGKRVELIRGEIIEMAPMKSPHATSIQLAYDLLAKIFQKEFLVRQQMPLSLSKSDEPEPDIAVVSGSARDFADAHPKTARLVIEVSDSSLRFDRKDKAELYAEHNIEEYWIVNLKQRCVEVYRRPVKDKNLGYAYTEISVFSETESVSPLAKPKGKIKVIDILP